MPSNAIVVENQKPGTPKSVWDLSAGGSDTIEGYATKVSVNRGTTVEFKINTNSTNYKIDIYRLGYYGGDGARLITTINKNTSSVQPAPGGNAALGLYDAGNWSVTASWAVPADSVSGVFLAKLTRFDGDQTSSHIPFIVRDDGVAHDIVFQTSETTWHAYNGWGGANLYGGNATASNDGRAYKVSYNRPWATRDAVGTYAGPQDFLFSAEIAAIRFIERNGYDVGYLSGWDVGPGNATLSNYKVFISTGHDEYWSNEQRTHVEAARDAGMHCIFQSGNEVYWKTRWEADLNGVANRTMVCYKESKSQAKLDPSPLWTGTWRDPGFSPPADGARPENGLTGTIFQVDSHRDDIIKVPYAYSRLRFWRNTTNVATTPSGGSTSLKHGLLGYEWDEAPDNGFRPGGAINLSSTTIDVDHYLLDYGSIVGPRTATHNLVLYKAPSGAIVFGAGTVFWSFGLDTSHDYANSGPVVATPVDPNVQQAMINLFADMGVQPGSLMAGMVAATASTDTTAPVSVITAPANGASVVQQALVNITGTASDVGGLVAGVEVSTDGGTTWRVATGTTSWSYKWYPRLPGTYTIKVRATDDSLNTETPGAGVTVTVTPAATVSLFTPNDKPFAVRTDDASSVELGVKFSVNTPGTVAGVKFYKNPDNVGAHSAHLWSPSGTLLASANFTGESASGWQQANFASPVAITPGTTYVASYHTAGLYSADTNYYLTPRTSGALTAPADGGAGGGNGVFAYGVAATFPTGSFRSGNYWVDVVFNRAGGAGNLAPTASNDSGFITAQDVALNIPAANLLAGDTDPNGYPLSISSVGSATHGAVAYDAGTQVVTFTPTAAYSGPATFQYTITNGHGGSASATVSLSVTPATVNQTLFGTGTPLFSPATDVNPVELGVKFKCSVAGSKVTGMRFYKRSGATGSHVAHLWSISGTLLGTASFTGETASGWQTVNFAAPINLTAGTSYVASYSTNGTYAATANYFTNAHTSGALTAPANVSSGGNGVFSYGPAGTFPTSNYNAGNYWVDPIVQVPTGLSTQTLFDTSDLPATLSVVDPHPVEVGVKFQATLGGKVTGIRFYKGTGNTGTHIGHLWSGAGMLLATVTFAGETASGWQTANLVSPVTLTAGTTYIVSYHATNGGYSATGNFFGTALTSGSLTAPSGTNGVFTYGPPGSFPTTSYNATNYWVDAVIQAPNV